ncbi:NAD-dependent epimerase/dehydratase family protein [Adhaeribacter sp. BT258]|uniref:NAD-dependent epimerase/dehydratase family protein n=1 Tax=Adhaeribacter terrigena TaxID=2793070 RepID=A0ABS1BYV5_9BACT|nr:NAD-dependent epimerase/dehydratase family protein [Adhaeribacter terrigena]MBK0401568.1 NAD-dependent epimerase/dehydratase family protein [Adhaeribacter terrigena]
MVVVTGATGLIGSFLVDALLQQGYEVRAISRRSFSGQNHSVLTWLQGDLLDPVFLAEAFEGATHVFHCAGLVSYAPQDKELLQQTNVEGTANVVNTCLALGNIKLCYVSSIAAVENEKNKPVADEEAKWDLNAEHSGYAESKYNAELEVWRGISEGLSAVIVNPSIVLGPGNWHESSTQLFRYVFEEKPFYTAGTANFVDVRDVVEMMLQLAFSEVEGERFILNGGQLTYEDFFQMVAGCFGKKAPGVKVAAGLANILWRLEHVRSLLTGKRPLITRDTARIAGRTHTYSSNKVKKVLTCQFRPLPETIAWSCAGLQEKLVQKTG